MVVRLIATLIIPLVLVGAGGQVAETMVGVTQAVPTLIVILMVFTRAELET